MKVEDYIFDRDGTYRTSNDGKLTTKIFAKLTTKQWYAAMEDYAIEYHESKVKNLSLSDVSVQLPDHEKIKAMANENADKWEKLGYDRNNLYDYFIMGAEAIIQMLKGN